MRRINLLPRQTIALPGRPPYEAGSVDLLLSILSAEPKNRQMDLVRMGKRLSVVTLLEKLPEGAEHIDLESGEYDTLRDAVEQFQYGPTDRAIYDTGMNVIKAEETPKV